MSVHATEWEVKFYHYNQPVQSIRDQFLATVNKDYSDIDLSVFFRPDHIQVTGFNSELNANIFNTHILEKFSNLIK